MLEFVIKFVHKLSEPVDEHVLPDLALHLVPRLLRVLSMLVLGLHLLVDDGFLSREVLLDVPIEFEALVLGPGHLARSLHLAGTLVVVLDVSVVLLLHHAVMTLRILGREKFLHAAANSGDIVLIAELFASERPHVVDDMPPKILEVFEWPPDAARLLKTTLEAAK